ETALAHIFERALLAVDEDDFVEVPGQAVLHETLGHLELGSAVGHDIVAAEHAMFLGVDLADEPRVVYAMVALKHGAHLIEERVAPRDVLVEVDERRGLRERRTRRGKADEAGAPAVALGVHDIADEVADLAADAPQY